MSKSARRLTLTLQVFFKRFKRDESWAPNDEYPHDVLDVFAKTDGLSDRQENGFDKVPQDGDGDEEGPQQQDASLQMDGQIGLADAACERLGSERVEGRSTSESDTPSCQLSWDPRSTGRVVGGTRQLRTPASSKMRWRTVGQGPGDRSPRWRPSVPSFVGCMTG